MNHILKFITIIFLIVPALFSYHPASHAAVDDGDLVVGRMKVSIMPEYDSTGVLIVQEGKFLDRNAFPRHVEFTIPEGVKKLTDVCSLSPGGQHFCQLYDIESKGDRSIVRVGLPYSDFFIDYKYTPFKIKKNSTRDFTYTVHSPYRVKILEVHIQKPFRSERFAISPASDDTYGKNDFDYHKYVLKDVAPGQETTFSVSYYKSDVRPSVDIKFSSMSSPGFFEKNVGEMFLASGLILLVALLYFKRRSRNPNR
jgi:hypothetical protein